MRLGISISGATNEEKASEGQEVGRDTDEVAVCCPRTQPDPLSQASGIRSARTRIEHCQRRQDLHLHSRAVNPDPAMLDDADVTPAGPGQSQRANLN